MSGDSSEQLESAFATLYPELRRLAHARLKANSARYIDTTALVHESFLRLVGKAQLEGGDRRLFFAYAAKTMRNIVIDLAREQLALRRGGHAEHVALTATLEEVLPGNATNELLVRIHDALIELERVDPTLARVVEMRYFAGFTESEVGQLLGMSERTVRRAWQKARGFLLVALEP